ncbi:Cu-binding protein, partial [Chytridiales sp. JEL 0842]
MRVRNSTPFAGAFNPGSRNSRVYSTTQQQDQKDKEDFTKFGWKSITAILASGCLLYAYFEYEKTRLDLQRKQSVNENVGKPLIGGPFALVDTNGRPVTDLDYKG